MSPVFVVVFECGLRSPNLGFCSCHQVGKVQALNVSVLVITSFLSPPSLGDGF